MLDRRSIANKTLDHIEERRAFLLPLGTIADQCWQILLVIFSAGNEQQAAERVASAVSLSLWAARRYFSLLEQYGYIIQKPTADGTGLQLSSDANRQIELLLTCFGQDIRSIGS